MQSLVAPVLSQFCEQFIKSTLTPNMRCLTCVFFLVVLTASVACVCCAQRLLTCLKPNGSQFKKQGDPREAGERCPRRIPQAGWRGVPELLQQVPYFFVTYSFLVEQQHPYFSFYNSGFGGFGARFRRGQPALSARTRSTQDRILKYNTYLRSAGVFVVHQ